jgi:antitoxin component of RelBE/YafQ-DinJ toxin-antitoxin module
MNDNDLYLNDISKEIQDRASEVLAGFGLTINDACRLFLIGIAQDKVNIFDFLTPNPKTLDALHELKNGGGTKFNNFAEFLEDLEGEE